MVLNIPGGEFLTGSLDVISQSLTIPVLVILLVIVIITIITLGGVIAEYTSRRKVPVGTIRDLIYEINRAPSTDALKSVIDNAKIPKAQKKVLAEIASSSELGNSSREALARKLFEFEEEKTMNNLQKTDIITRIGPTLGLVGIGSGALCYVMGKIRSGWYDRYLSDLDALIDAVLDKMNNQ